MCSAERAVTGGCLCGAVRYEIHGPLREVIACHCGQCLRQHGNFATYSATGKNQLRLLKDGELAWYASSQKARRGFCRACGSSLFWEPLDRDYIAVSAGSFDGPSPVKLTKHIYVKDKPSYYELTDGLPAFRESSLA